MTVARTSLKKHISNVPTSRSVYQSIHVYFALTKPRIMLMLLFTAFCAMIAAQKGMPSLQMITAALGGLALSTGGAAALNMWYDRDIDAIMQRTAQRPIPAKLIQPNHAFWFGCLLEVLSALILWTLVNPLTALLAFAGFIYYVLIYTIWLKRRTPQNIVIGGGAGAFPPLVGWAAVTGHLSWSAWVMFLIIFFWTPPHFWALALYKNEDYVRANIPMMPVIKGPTVTKVQSLMYTLLLLGITLGYFIGRAAHWLYIAAALISGVVFVVLGLLLLTETNPDMRWAKRTFRYSLLYLPIVFILAALS